MRKLRAFALAALTTLALALSTALPVAAVYTGNLAGRPIDGTAYGSNGNDCHGIAYGRAGGSLVLFSASHCRPSAGAPAIGPDGTVIGTWTSVTAGDPYDLTYITLNSGAHPSVLNKVYSNNGSGGYTITRNPSSALSCASGVPTNTTVYQAFQTTSTSTYGPQVGIVNWMVYPNGVGNAPCRIETNVPWHGPTYKDSASPWFAAGHLDTVMGHSWSNDPLDSNHLQVAPLYDGLNALNSYWVGRNGTGAWLCQTASC